MTVGFFALEWRSAAADLGSKNPQTTMERLLTLLWDTVTEQLWAERNQIKHSKESKTLEHDKSQQIDQLLWYLRHQNEVLDYRHRYLTDFNLKDVHRWTRHTRSTRLQHLHNARKYYETECKQKAQNQTTIFDWLHSFTTLRSGRTIGPGIRQQPPEPLQPIPEDSSTSTEEAEFEWSP